MAVPRRSGALVILACTACVFVGSAQAQLCRYYEVDKVIPWEAEENENFGGRVAADDDEWIEHVKLTTPHGSTEDRFGTTLSLAGDRLVVAAPGVYAADDETGPGCAYVFRRNHNGTPDNLSDDTWQHEAQLAPSDGNPGDYFGYALAIGDNRVIAGAPAPIWWDWSAGRRTSSGTTTMTHPATPMTTSGTRKSNCLAPI